MFTSSTKCEINYFHVVVVQWAQRNLQKGVMYVQSYCFANLNLLLLLFSLTSMKSLLKLPIKCHFMTDGKSDKTIVTLTTFWLVYHCQSMKRSRPAFFTAFIVLAGTGKYRGKTGERGTGTPAFCVRMRKIFVPSASPLSFQTPAKKANRPQ